MKILFLNPVGAIGGAERVLLTVLATLLNIEPNIQLHLIVGTEGPLIEQAKNLGVEVKLLKLPAEFNQLGDSAWKGNSQAIALLILLWRLVQISPSLIQYLRKFQRSLQEINPDLIHSNGIKTHLLMALAGAKQIPVVWHIHDFYGSRPFMAQVLKWVSRNPKRGIAVSQAVAEDARITLPRLPVEVIYNAVDINYFSPTPLPAQATLSIGLVATFAKWKGHNIFLEAAASVVRSHPELNLRFCIIGEPIYQTRGSQFSLEELKKQVLDLGLGDQVNFLGFQQDMAKIYQSLDIVVHASIQPEPYGLVIVEAMACGRPVIVSQAGGAAELFTHNYDAVGVLPGEPTALATAILDLINHPQKRQIISENARLTVIKRFNYQGLGQQILTFYNLVLNS